MHYQQMSPSVLIVDVEGAGMVPEHSLLRVLIAVFYELERTVSYSSSF